MFVALLALTHVKLVIIRQVEESDKPHCRDAGQPCRYVLDSVYNYN